jgi:hypothetical protein
MSRRVGECSFIFGHDACLCLSKSEEGLAKNMSQYFMVYLNALTNPCVLDNAIGRKGGVADQGQMI